MSAVTYNAHAEILCRIGSIHLLLPMLPTKVLKVVAAFGWTPDRPLGISMLKECAANKRVRAPMAASM
jgi:hypothetical protein